MTHLNYLKVKKLCDDLDIDLAGNTTKPYALSALSRLFGIFTDLAIDENGATYTTFNKQLFRPPGA